MPTLVSLPRNLSPQAQGIPKFTSSPIDVLEIVLDADGRAFDKTTGYYLKLIETPTTMKVDLGTPEGVFMTVRLNAEDKLMLAKW